MLRGEKRANRKVLLAVSFVFSGLVIAETAATADDAGQADAAAEAGNADTGNGSADTGNGSADTGNGSADTGNPTADAGHGSNYGPNKSNICSVAPHGLYGAGFGAGCC